MRGMKNRKKNFFLELIMVCLLIIVGSIFVGQTFNEYGRVFLNNQDEQLVRFAKLVDRNIDTVLGRCMDNLDYVIKEQDFIKAEKTWLKTGKTKDLLTEMTENFVTYDHLILTTLAIRENQIFLSTDGKKDYKFMDKIGSKRIQPCVGEDGTIYLALFCEGREKIRYAALMDLDIFYKQIIGEEMGEYDWIILTDESGEILMYNQGGKLRVEWVDAVTGATCGKEGVKILLSQQKKQKTDTAYYEYRNPVTDETYTARMVTLPTKDTQNKAFAVGAVTNYEDIIEPFHKAAFQLVIYGGIVIAGALLLLRIVFRFKKTNDRDMEELEILREKNAAMAELNKQTKELAHHQRLETIGMLTSGIAHEFNNLLTPIMGYSILTLEQIPSDREDLQDNILEIYQASCRAKDITTQLSKLSRKNASSVFGKVVLDDLVEKVLQVAVPVMPDNVEVKKQLEAGRVSLEGNETQIFQLVLNLVLNGFQAMEETGGTLTVTTFEEEEKLVLKVKDEGVGISAHLIDKIFDPFFTTKEAGKGTGLGLAIVQEVIGEQHGTIQVETEEGKGCLFRVDLPKKIPEENKKDSESES